jgi:hypothetical protein
MVKKHVKTKNESFSGGKNMTPVMDYDIERYSEVVPKRFRTSFADFDTMTRNEGVRDSMTPKSEKEILKNIPKFTELYNDVKSWTKGMEDVSVSDIDYDTNGVFDCVYFKIYIIDNESGFGDYGRNALKVTCYNDEDLFLSLKGRYSSQWESIKYRVGFPDVIREMNKLRKGINESVRDKMTPKSDEEIRMRKDEIIGYIKNVVRVNRGRLTMNQMKAEFDEVPVWDVTTTETKDNVHHLIDKLYGFGVNVIEWDTWQEKVVYQYKVKYEELTPEILMEIKEIIEQAISWEIIKEK